MTDGRRWFVDFGMVSVAACLWFIPPTSMAGADEKVRQTATLALSAKATSLQGTYESVPLNSRVAVEAESALATLNSLPLTSSAKAAQINRKPGPDPKDACQVLGPFRLMARADIRFEILPDAPDKLVMLFENEAWGHVRTIGMDAEHPKDFTKIRPMWNGDSISRWEGDVLVIDTVHFTNKTWLNERGVFNSKQLHLTERLRMVSGGKYLEYESTADDPDVLAHSARYTRYFKRIPDEIVEYSCFAHKA